MPRHVTSAVMGAATTMGAYVSIVENPMPQLPAMQPGYEWTAMATDECKQTDLIRDLA
ncbi:MAG: hypothetical protein RIA65_16080 [Woeseia sp.]